MLNFKKFLPTVSVRAAQVFGLAVLLLSNAADAGARESQAQLGSALGWLGEPERRLHSQIGDLVQLESQTLAPGPTKNTSTWESQQLGVGDWDATTTFHVVDGRVKRLMQEAIAPLQYCDERMDWGEVGRKLSQELGTEPMVYAPTMVSGLWQQAALWHANRMTVVVYRTLTVGGECRTRMSIQ
jgi:hypothetical protein